MVIIDVRSYCGASCSVSAPADLPVLTDLRHTFDGNVDYLTIDLDQVRAGRCYDSFWDRHGVAGSCSIIATSFTDLLTRLYEHRSQHWYWLRPDFRSFGDAYDL